MSKDILNTVNAIVVTNFRSFRAVVSQKRDIRTIFFVEFNSYSFNWTLKRDSFITVVRNFHAIIEQYRQTRVYQNFLFVTKISSSNNDSSNKFRSKFFTQQSFFSITDRVSITSQRFNSFFISNAFKNDKFNNSEKKSYVRLSIASSFSISIESFDNRHFSTKQFFTAIVFIQSTDIRQISVSKNKNDETSFTNTISIDSFFDNFVFASVQTKEISRSMFIFSFVSTDVDSVFWNDLLIMIQIFNIVRFSISDFNFVVVIIAVDADKSIIDFAKNIDYFDSNYENSFEKNFLIIIFERHTFYRDVFIFTDRLKNLKKKISDSRIKKYVFVCMKNIVFIWLSIEFNSLKKKLFRKIEVEDWCFAFIRRFKKRDVVALKKLQSFSYIYADCRSDKTSRAYVQNILRHFRAIDYDFIYHQLLNAWSDFELDFRMQISNFIFDIQLNTFLNSLDSKTTIWIKMIVKRAEKSSFDNNVDKNRLISKQNNRERQNDFSQQSSVNEFSFSNIQFFWSFQNYTSYQFQNFAYQNQKFQY